VNLQGTRYKRRELDVVKIPMLSRGPAQLREAIYSFLQNKDSYFHQDNMADVEDKAKAEKIAAARKRVR
jgi:hypothetical protein